MRINFLTLSIAISLLISCGESNSTKSNEKENEISSISVDFVKTFEGEINGKYPIIAKIQSNSGKITGNYYYKKVGQELEIKGTLAESGEISLNEFDEDGKQTGVFIGTLLNNNKIEGTWSKPNKNQRMPFVLIESNAEYTSFKKELQELKGISGRYESPLNDGGISMGTTIIRQSKGRKFRFEITVANQKGCTGELTGEITINTEKVGVFSSKTCKKLKFEFFNQELKISETDCDEHGMNCWFSGTYKKKI